MVRATTARTFSAVVTFDTLEVPASKNTFLLSTTVLAFYSGRVPFHCMRPSLTSLCREVVPTAVFDGSELFLPVTRRFPLKPASQPGSRTFSLSIWRIKAVRARRPRCRTPRKMDQARDLTIRRSQRAFRRRQQKKDPQDAFHRGAKMRACCGAIAAAQSHEPRPSRWKKQFF